MNDKREEWTNYQQPLDFISKDEREVEGIRKVFKGSVVFSTLMPSTQIVRRESSSQMHSGHRVEYLSSASSEARGAKEVARGFLERSKRGGEVGR